LSNDEEGNMDLGLAGAGIWGIFAAQRLRGLKTSNDIERKGLARRGKKENNQPKINGEFYPGGNSTGLVSRGGGEYKIRGDWRKKKIRSKLLGEGLWFCKLLRGVVSSTLAPSELSQLEKRDTPKTYPEEGRRGKIGRESRLSEEKGEIRTSTGFASRRGWEKTKKVLGRWYKKIRILVMLEKEEKEAVIGSYLQRIPKAKPKDRTRFVKSHERESTLKKAKEGPWNWKLSEFAREEDPMGGYIRSGGDMRDWYSLPGS